MRPTTLHTPYQRLDPSAERLRDLAAWLDEAAPEMASAARRAASEMDAASAPGAATDAPPDEATGPCPAGR